MELLLLCVPKEETYKGKPYKEISEGYLQMGITDFDKLVKFHPDYEQFKETPDYKEVVGKKESMNLEMSLFIQPVKKVGDLNLHLESWSYLFNPKYEKEILPDLDVIHLRNGDETKEAAEIIKNFYENHGWEVYVMEENIPARDAMVKVNPKRALTPGNQVAITDPRKLRQIAKEKLIYNLEELCFQVIKWKGIIYL